jgi:hypothetical protein
VQCLLNDTHLIDSKLIDSTVGGQLIDRPIDRPYNRNQSLSNVVTTRLRKGSLERLEKALERLQCPSKLVKCCHNQADKGPGKAGKALERLK